MRDPFFELDKQVGFDFMGGVITPLWFSTITKDDKPDWLAINIMGEILDFYKPVIIEDSVKPRHSGKLPRSYMLYTEMFNVSCQEVEEAFERLIKIGIITCEFDIIFCIGPREKIIPNIFLVDINADLLDKLGLIYW
jgi:hypothetical protein